MLAITVGPSQAPWWVWVAVGALLVFGIVAKAVSTAGSAVKTASAFKLLVNSIQSQVALRHGPAQGLAAPLDLNRESLSAAILTDPTVAAVTSIIGAVAMVRKAGNTTVPHQYLTERLAERWSTLPNWPSGLFSLTEFHARPLTPVPVGDRMLVWFTGRINLGATFTEYWTFVTSAPLGSLPAVCPNCGAPTGGNSTGVCAYCHTTIVISTPPSSMPVKWIVDDISVTLPAEAAA